MRTPAESDRYYQELAAARAEKARHPTPGHEMARARAEAMGVKVPSHEQIAARMAADEERQNQWQRDRGVEPVPSSPEAACNICRPDDLTSEGKPADLETKGVKRQLAALTDLVARHIHSDNIIHATGECPVTGGEDGSSDRPVHDPSVPYEDMPGDEVQSLPMCSTAPVEGKARVSHEKRGMVHGADLGGFTVEQAKMLMNPVEPVMKEFADAGPGTFPSPSAAPAPSAAHGDIQGPGSFLRKLDMEAQRNPGDNTPGRPGCAPAPRPADSPDPADISRVPLTDGHAAVSPGAEHVKANPGHTNASPVESPKNEVSTSANGVNSTRRPNFTVSQNVAPSFSKPSFDNVARTNPE